MSIITKVGTEAKKSAESAVDLDKVYLRLKDGESHKVRLLTASDYVEYNAVGDFELDIYTQPVSGDDSPLVVAYKKGGEKFKGLFTKQRYVMVFASLETGQLVAWECGKQGFKNMLATINEYEDSLDELAFNLKRLGASTDTVYALNPIIKLKPEEKEAFDKFNETVVEMDFYESIIKPKPDKMLASILKENGFDVAKHLPHIDLSEETDKQSDLPAKPVDISDDNLPF